MTALSPKDAERLAAEAEEARKNLTPATHADVVAYVEALRAEVKEDSEDASAVLLTLLKEAEDMLTWDEADLPPREDLTWEDEESDE